MDTSEYNENHYSQLFEGKGAEKYYESTHVKINRCIKMFGDMKGKKIIDIGCGDGFIAAKIGKCTGAEMFGVDISKEALKKAKKQGIKTKFANLEKGKLPFEAGSFDAAFCGDVIEHVFDTEHLLSEIKRILKPDGFVVMSLPNIAAWYNRIIMMLGFIPVWVESASVHYVGNPFLDKGMGHVKAFTKHSALQLLRLMGFKAVKLAGSPMRGDGHMNSAVEGIWNRTDNLFSKFPSLSSLILIKAKPLK